MIFNTVIANSGGGIEYEIITVPANVSQVNFTLTRITNLFGMVSGTGLIYPEETLCIVNSKMYLISPNSADFAIVNSMSSRISNGTIDLCYGSSLPITLILINDPDAEAIYT